MTVLDVPHSLDSGPARNWCHPLPPGSTEGFTGRSIYFHIPSENCSVQIHLNNLHFDQIYVEKSLWRSLCGGPEVTRCRKSKERHM